MNLESGLGTITATRAKSSFHWSRNSAKHLKIGAARTTSQNWDKSGPRTAIKTVSRRPDGQPSAASNDVVASTFLCCACDQETVNLQDGEAQMRMHSVASNGKLRLRRQRPQKELCKKQPSFLLNTPLEPLPGYQPFSMTHKLRRPHHTSSTLDVSPLSKLTKDVHARQIFCRMLARVLPRRTRNMLLSVSPHQLSKPNNFLTRFLSC